MWNEKNYDFASKENLIWLHGILAILVFCGHVPNWLGLYIGTTIGSILSSFGEWCVALFFFLSGFGLMQQYRQKGTPYVEALPHKELFLYI